MTQEELEAIGKEVAKHIAIQTKRILTFSEAVEYTGFTTSYLYKLMSQRIVPYYKPNGKSCFFDRAELENWMLSNRVTTNAELDSEARSYTLSKYH